MAALGDSRYTPIWLKLKADHKVSVVIPSPLHKRLIKAVIKRKDEDVTYKFILGEQGKKARLKYSVQENVIHFKLTFWLGKGIGEL